MFLIQVTAKKSQEQETFKPHVEISKDLFSGSSEKFSLMEQFRQAAQGKNYHGMAHSVFEKAQIKVFCSLHQSEEGHVKDRHIMMEYNFFCIYGVY